MAKAMQNSSKPTPTGRRAFLSTALTLPLASTANAAPTDPLIALCEEYRGHVTAFEQEKDEVAYYALADKVTACAERICGTKAISIEGLQAQFDFFVRLTGEEITGLYSPKFAAILPNIDAGIKQLKKAATI